MLCCRGGRFFFFHNMLYQHHFQKQLQCCINVKALEKSAPGICNSKYQLSWDCIIAGPDRRWEKMGLPIIAGGQSKIWEQMSCSTFMSQIWRNNCALRVISYCFIIRWKMLTCWAYIERTEAGNWPPCASSLNSTTSNFVRGPKWKWGRKSSFQDVQSLILIITAAPTLSSQK